VDSGNKKKAGVPSGDGAEGKTAMGVGGKECVGDLIS